MHNHLYEVERVYHALCSGIDSPVSLGCWLRFKAGEYHQLANVSVSPGDYADADSFGADYLVVNFLRKYKGLPTGIDLEEVALRKLAESEARCREFNLRLKTPVASRFEGVILTAQRLASTILGPIKVERMLSLCKWGPGATSSIARRNARIDKKISILPMSCTRLALAMVRTAIGDDPAWGQAFGLPCVGPWSPLPSMFEVVDANRVVTVPKDARSDRVISCEPTGNSFLQQGVGRWLRQRLKKFGIDLDDQRLNQTWAEKACELGLATLDLSSASDSVSRELVALILPLDWYLFLDTLRSPKSVKDGKEFYNERFSSMGNAFTFELESLIFYCLTRAAVDEMGGGIVSVYGDDIITPVSAYDHVCASLEAVGFVVNREKSYSYGRFHESCGRHYFDEYEVTPAYQKDVLATVPDLIRCHNRLMRWALRSGLGVCLDSRVRKAVNHLRGRVAALVQPENRRPTRGRHAQARYPRGKDPVPHPDSREGLVFSRGADWDGVVRLGGFSVSVPYALPLGSEGDEGLLVTSRDCFGRNVALSRVRCFGLRPVTTLARVDDAAMYAWSLRRGVVVDFNPPSPYGYLRIRKWAARVAALACARAERGVLPYHRIKHKGRDLSPLECGCFITDTLDRFKPVWHDVNVQWEFEASWS